MNSAAFDIVKSLIEKKKYDVITEYSHVVHPEKGDIIVTEYTGKGVRAYKDNTGITRVLCPKDIDVIQEGHVAQAIANGTIFDDADEVDRNATMIERTTIPYDAMINSGKDTPKQLKPMIAIVIGRMDDNGSFKVSDADRTNGENFVRDLCDKEKCEKVTDVVDNYIEKKPEDFYTPEMGKGITELDKEVDDICDTKPEDCVTDNDCCDSYDDYDMEKIESDNTDEMSEEPELSDDTETEEPEEDSDDDTETTDEVPDEDNDIEECGDCDTTVEECGDSCKNEVVEEGGECETCSDPTKNVAPEERPGAQKINPHLQQEGFFDKKPKKLKPIPRDTIAYITVEMNDIHSANDQAMLAGYTCSKIELVDFYLTVLDTQDARYIVPHNKQYLVQMKNDLERLLTQILKIRPINRSEQIWRVNYPS